ncbi:ATP-binding protein [Chloroflexus sp.]|uniref:sensor histidine kinase n=1 Tax=Chloroflexus sp. TaxID=1904827 RepID=UPI002ADE3187|nr:ATP-binding protein [Chloroflexus sp.]
MKKMLPVDLPEWLTIVAKMIDAERYADLTAAAIDVLTSMLPGYQVDIKLFQSDFQDESDALVHRLGQRETFAWLVIRPADLTDDDLIILQSVEQLIVAGYERIRQRIERQGWHRRLQLEVDALRDTPQPELICQRMVQLLTDLVGLPLTIGLATPIHQSVWLQQIVHYAAQPNRNDISEQRCWTAETDLSSMVIKLSMPLSSAAYLEDCARYNVRPHAVWLASPPTFWSGVPVRFGGKTFGVIYGYTFASEPLNETQQQMIAEALELAVRLLRTPLLQREVDLANQQHNIWQKLVATSVQLLDTDQALQTMLDLSCQLLVVEGGGLFIFDEQHNELVFRYAYGRQSHQLVGMRLPMTHGIIGQSFALGKPVIVNDASDDVRLSRVIDRVIGLKCYNLITVPFTSPSGVRFCLQYINRQDEVPFIDTDIDEIQATAALMSLVIDRTRQITQIATGIVQQAQDLDRDNADLRSLLVLNHRLLAEQSPDQLFQLIIDSITKRMRFQSAALFVSQREHALHSTLACVAATGTLSGEFPAGLRLAIGRLDALVNEWGLGDTCFLLNRRSASFATLFDLPQPVSERLMDFGAIHWQPDDLLVVLLRAPDHRVQGVLLLDQPQSGQRPAMADLQVLTLYAGIAGSAIDIALLRYRQQRSLERLTALNGLGMVINSQSLPQPQVLVMTARGMLEMVEGNWAQIMLFDPEHDELHFDQTIGMSPLGKDVVLTLARRALLHRRPVFRSATTVAIPLRSTQQIIGVIVIGGEHALEAADVEMLTLYASQTAIAIESMRLLDAVRRGHDNLARVMAAVEDGLVLFGVDGTVMVANEAFHRLARTVAWSPPLLRIDGLKIDNVLECWARQRVLEPATVAELQRSLTCIGARNELHGNDGVFAWKIIQAGDLIAGRTSAFLLTIRDVTEAKKVEQLREDLTRMVIHDLKNPLTAIKLAFERLEDELGDLFTERQQQAMKIGQNNTTRLIDLVKTMLDIGRLESGQMPLDKVPLPIADLIEYTVDRLLFHAQEKQVQIVHEVDPHVHLLFADSNIVSRVLQNLLDNALKFSEPESQIAIEVRMKPAQGQSQIVAVSDELAILVPGDRVAHIIVRDQGPGIPPEEQDVIFKRFSQGGRKRSEGSGLGLAFCKLAVEAHRGAIWVESMPGRGSAFHFTLPLAEIYDPERA